MTSIPSKYLDKKQEDPPALKADPVSNNPTTLEVNVSDKVTGESVGPGQLKK